MGGPPHLSPGSQPPPRAGGGALLSLHIDARSGDRSGSGLDLLLDSDGLRGRGLEAQPADGDPDRTSPLRHGAAVDAVPRPRPPDRSRHCVNAYERAGGRGILEARRSWNRVARGPAPNPPAPPPAGAPRRPARSPARRSRPHLLSAAGVGRGTAGRVLRGAPPSVLGYGDPRGSPELRVTLARYLGRARGVSATADRVLVVNGFNRALSLWARTLRGRGHHHVAVEEPTLPLARQLLRHAGFTVHPVPVDEDGLDVDALGRHSRDGGAGGARAPVSGGFGASPRAPRGAGAVGGAARRRDHRGRLRR